LCKNKEYLLLYLNILFYSGAIFPLPEDAKLIHFQSSVITTLTTYFRNQMLFEIHSSHPNTFHCEGREGSSLV
jgi:hypothetical protein